MKNLFIAVCCICSFTAFAQMQVDKKIEMTGASSADKKIEGIEEVVNSHDAANKMYVDTTVANASSGSVSIASINCDTIHMTDGSFFLIQGAIFAYAHAGEDQLDLPGASTVQLNAKAPNFGTGTWSVIGGTAGANFSNVNDPKATFTGNASTSYELQWSVNTPCGNDSDRVVISFGIVPPVRVFITSLKYIGALGGLAGADQKCQDRANAAGLGGTWTAFLSSSTVDARDRITQHTFTYQLLNGTIVANNWNDLTDGTLDNPIDITEIGTNIGEFVWTNTTSNGVKYTTNLVLTCQDWTSGSWEGVTGVSTVTDNRWAYFGDESCGTQRRLYCFEDL